MNRRHCIKFLLVATVSLSGIASYAQSASKFTANEQAQVNGMAASVERLCTTQVTAKLKEEAARLKDGTLPAWVARLTSGNYCNCIAQRIRTTVTPEMIRHGTEADGQKIIKDAANECAVANFRATFPEVCRSWTDDLPPSVKASGITPQQKEVACECVQRRVNKVTGETLAITTQDSIADYMQWQRNPRETTRGREYSIVGDIMSCYRDAGLVVQQ